MKEYEVSIEEVTPCGGDKHARRSIIEIETDSPENWVRENCAFKILDVITCENGDIRIIAGSDAGYRNTYVFSE
ncbi:MAG: hypothetical protein MJ067_01505 [Oscillospiraceae bacterium]|nr:hypothetical protein [Oscillospiraceae bacterium]